MSELVFETRLYWAAVVSYAVATVVLAHAIVFRHPRRVRYGFWAAVVGLLPHGVAVAHRWIASRHGPYMAPHEVLPANAWLGIAAFVGFAARRPRWRSLGLVVLPVALLAMAFGLFSNPAIRDLPPSLRSVWLVVHVGFAKISAAAFLLSTASAVLLLQQPRRRPGSWLDQLPAHDALDAYVVRFAAFGTLFWTITVAAGAIWAHQAWGRYWGWDAIETWSLVTWLVYAAFLHAKLFFRLGPSTTAWAAIGTFVVFVLTLAVLPLWLASAHAAYFQ